MSIYAFAEADGFLYATNGFGPVLRWDGRTATMVDAGMSPPDSALTLSGSGRGHIFGTYFAFVRFTDDANRVSNFSPISNAYEALSAAGAVLTASAATPILVKTDSPHGLVTGDTVRIEDSTNNDANGDWTVTVTVTDEFTLDDSSAAVAGTGGTWSSGVDTINYADVPLPTDAKVTRRQILRNTAGQADVFYVDVDTTDLSSTSFSSTRDDEELSTQATQALLDSLGQPLANRHHVPPQSKIAVVHHQDRLWFLGEDDYTFGNVKVTLGSTMVVGVDTNWVAALAGRFLHVDGARTQYEIASVDVAEQTLELVTQYLDADDKFASYAIRSSTADAKRVQFTEPGLPESAPPTNALDIRQNGDRLIGGYVSGAYLYVVEKRHLHRIVFGENPLRDGGIFQISQRGCLNQRCFALVGEQTYMLDEQGVHSNDPNGGESVSEPIQEIFRPESSSKWRINWRVRAHFFSVHFDQQDTLRWFVALAGSGRPRHALAYNYRLQRWWIEEYPRPITSACVGHVNGVPVVFFGTDARQVCAFWQGYEDFAPSAGTKRGTVTGAGMVYLDDSAADFVDGMVGAPLRIVDGRGKGQGRRIVETTATRLTVQWPWLVRPDVTSVYQVGGVYYRWRSKRLRLPESDVTMTTGIEGFFEPTSQPTTMDVRVYKDFKRRAEAWKNPMSSAGGDGVRVDADGTDFVIDLKDADEDSGRYGHWQKRMDRHKAVGLRGRRFASVELSGATNGEPVRVYEMTLMGLE